MIKKYEMTSESITIYDRTLYRIRALVNFSDVEAGDLGGYIEFDNNLSHSGRAWVYDDAKVFGNAKIYEHATIYDRAQVYDDAKVHGNAKVCGDAKVFAGANVYGDAKVSGSARVLGTAVIYDHVHIFGDATISGNASIYGCTDVCGNTRFSGDSDIYSDPDYIVVNGVDTKSKPPTFCRKNGEVMVSCDRFVGTIQEFRDQIREYLTIADAIESQIGPDGSNDNAVKKMLVNWLYGIRHDTTEGSAYYE